MLKKKTKNNESIQQKAEHGSSLEHWGRRVRPQLGFKVILRHHTLNYKKRTLNMILSSINNVLGLKPGGIANWQSCKHGLLSEVPHRSDLFLLVLCIVSIILHLVSCVVHRKNHMSHLQIKIMASERVFFFVFFFLSDLCDRTVSDTTSRQATEKESVADKGLARWHWPGGLIIGWAWRKVRTLPAAADEVMGPGSKVPSQLVMILAHPSKLLWE